MATDRVPTKWFAAIATGLFLAATAAFGGLADVSKPAAASIEIGEPHTTEQVTLEVQDVVLVDDLPELFLDLEEGRRVVVVLVHATNEWTEPQSTTLLESGIRDLIRLDLDGLRDAAPTAIFRVDDVGYDTTVLQPDLRVPLGFVWSVPAADVSDGDSVRVQVFDQTFSEGQVVWSARLWGDPVLAGTLEIAVTDLGTGEDAL